MMGPMPPAVVYYLASSAAYAGFQWTVRVVVYPQFSAVLASDFADYERLHQRRITFVVGPLFAALVLASAWLIFDRPQQVPWWAALAAAGLVAAILGITAFAAVPLHRRLSVGWDQATYARLLAVDLLRALLATVNLAGALVIAALV
jgi:hypothetical protein